jgi:DNA-binding NarL/FixJ family response regulator
MRVILADDQPEVRSALRLIVEQEVELTVVGEAGDAEDLLSLAGIIDPDLLLLDWELPGPPAVDGHSTRFNGRMMSALRSLCPQVFIIALSGLPESRGAALAAGADAFVSKGDSPERLLAVLRSRARPAESTSVEPS